MTAPVLQPGDRFLRLRDVAALVGLSKPSLYRLIKAGAFPAGHPLGVQYTRWIESEVRAWMQARLEAAAAQRRAS